MPTKTTTDTDKVTGPPVLAPLIDALLSYAIDPAEWERLAAEVDASVDQIDEMAPAEFLMHLSRAESLAWQMRTETADSQTLAFAYLVLDDHDRILVNSENIAGLTDSLTIGTPTDKKLSQLGMLRFKHPETQAAWNTGRQRMADSQSGHILIEIKHPTLSEHRFGYLVAQKNFPPPLRSAHTGASHALLIAQDQPSDQLRRVVQASFGLTTSEAALTLKLATGLTLKECSEALNISVNTARNHLQAVFDKSGVKRQPDLILVVTQLSVILASAATPDEDEPPFDEPDASSYPAREFMVIPDPSAEANVRRLSYCTYGDPNGTPVIYFHETFGSCRLLPGTDQLATQHGLFIVAPERPGVGFSDPVDNYTFESSNQDLERLLDHLDLAHVSLAGFISGGGYALAAAAELGPQISHTWLIASRSPLPPTDMEYAGASQHLKTVRTRLFRQPWMVNTFFNILRSRASQALNRRLLKRVYGTVPADRQLLVSRPEVLEHMAAYTRDSMAVTTKGVIGDLQCYQRSNAVTLTGLESAVHVWHGSRDAISSLSELEAFLGDTPFSKRLFDNEGSLIVYNHWAELIAEIAELIRA